ncbi:hypothetical protein KPL70_000611 [Citrus sinensis]|nr:hypothetical protein KPL70_000611 [Citrus sinensis]
MIPPYMIQLRKLLNMVKLIRYKTKDFNIYLIDITKIISILPNPIDQITFFEKYKTSKHLSHISKEIYSLIIKRKKGNGGWIDDKIECWAFSTLTLMIEKRIDKILSSFAHNVIYQIMTLIIK